MIVRALRAYLGTPPELRSPWLLRSSQLRGPRSLARLRERAGAGGTGAHVEVVPAGRVEPSGAVLWFHGGGHIAGSALAETSFVEDLADDLGAVVIAVDYRLAPQDPFPAALQDAYDALADVHVRSAELGVDRARVAVAGASAGAGLAAALAQLARDRGEHPICFQSLRYPMLDDRTGAEGERGRHFVWSARSNQYAWRCYLGEDPARLRRTGQAPPPYAAPARTDDLSGLPAAWVGVGDADLFHDEAVGYAARLAQAGVAVRTHVVPGMYHGADGLRPDAASMRAFLSDERAALRAALGAPLA